MSFIRFRLSVLAGFLLVVGSVMALMIQAVARVGSREAEESARAELEVARRIFDRLMAERWMQMRTQVRLLGSDFAFKRALASRHARTIASNAISLRNRLGADAVWVADGQGRLFADTTGALKAGDSIGGLAVTHGALGGDSAARVEIVAGRPYLIAAASIPLDEGPAPVLLAGFGLDDRAVQDLRDLTGSDVTLAHGGTVVASSLEGRGRAALARQAREQALRGGALELAGERYVVVSAPVGGRFVAYLQRSLGAHQQAQRRLTRLLSLLALLGLAVTAGAGYALTARATESVQRLVEETRRLNGELRQTNRFQENFLAMVVHDVGNPLAVALGNAELLRERAQDADQRSRAERVARAMETIQFLISDLVDFAAIETGKLRVQPAALDPGPVLEELRGRVEALANKQGLSFHAEIPVTLPRVKADGRRLAQALQNLCANACHYTPAGGRVRLRVVGADARLEFHVEDTGIGISEADRSRIFQRFFQADNAVSHRGAGLGLGLKIAQEIVSAHGGVIEVASTLGKGSRFWFSVPRAVDEATQNDPGA